MTEADRPITATSDAPGDVPAYCRRCGYALRGLAGAGRCPECGGAFDLADRKTFARRPPRPRLRWWAWRLSITLVLLAAAVASVPGWYWWQWHKEQQVLAEFRPYVLKIERVEPAGLGRCLPDRWAYLHDRASRVGLHGRTADKIARIDFASLTYVQELELSNCQVTDAALARLGGLTRLRVLDLRYNPTLDGSGLSHLSPCRQLEGLVLSATRADDAVVASLPGRFPALARLALGGTRVTDVGLASLAELRALEDLELSQTAVTPTGLRRLAGLTRLRVVWVERIVMTRQEDRDLQALMPNVDWRR